MPEEPTTPDLEELVRTQLEAVNHRDFDAALAMFAPDAVWATSGFEGAFEGREAIRGLLESWIAPYEDYELVLEEFRDLGNGVMLADVLWRGRPTGSSVFVEARQAWVSIVRDGVVERGASNTDRDQARAAAERLAQERG
jgi:ketosteroid isomerase-like protein